MLHIYFCYLISKPLICVFINILLLMRRNSSKLFQRRRNKKV